MVGLLSVDVSQTEASRLAQAVLSLLHPSMAHALPVVLNEYASESASLKVHTKFWGKAFVDEAQ
jgi:hypothetical protein